MSMFKLGGYNWIDNDLGPKRFFIGHKRRLITDLLRAIVPKKNIDIYIYIKKKQRTFSKLGFSL